MHAPGDVDGAPREAAAGRLARLAPWSLVATVAAVFWPALAGQPVYDDEVNFQHNVVLRGGSLADLCTQPFYLEHLGYWRPASSLLMAFGYRTAGLFGVHLLALLLHTLATLVAHRIARRELGDARAAFAAALLFALHPVQVESVAWASALSWLLCSLCTLCAADAALRWRDAQAGTWPWRPAAWVALALLASESGAIAVLLVPALVACVRTPAAQLARLGLALAAPFVAWLALRAQLLPNGLVVRGGTGEGAVLVSGAAEMLMRSLALLFAPWPLTPFRALHVDPGLALAPIVAALAALVFATWKRWPQRWRVALVLLVVPMVLPATLHRALGEHPLADRYLYLPALGAALAWVALVHRSVWLLAAPIAACAIASFTHSGVWRDQAAFVAHCASCEPGNAAVQVISGNVHLAAAQAGDASQIEWARRAYTNALTSCSVSGRPAADDLAAKARLGLAWCDLVEQQRRGAVDAASLVLRFRAGLASQSAAPSAWVGIGIAHGLAQQVDEARRAFGNAIELDPRCPEAWFNLGYLQLETGRSAEARASLERSLQCDPDLREAADLLARLR